MSVRILLLNDTRVDPNPGCQVTVTKLIAELERTTGATITSRPRGDGYAYFAPLIERKESHSQVAWEAAVEQFVADTDFRSALDAADVVAINLEGTLHHHSTGSLALAGAMAAAHQRRKPVWALNGSVEAVDRWLLDRALVPAELISVREPRSHRWLRSQGIDAVCAADCAFLSNEFADRCHERAMTGMALYTPGVLARLPGPRSEPARAIADMRILAAHGLRPTYFQVDDAEGPIVEQVRREGWEVLTATETPWQSLPAVLDRFDLLVSGRYHILIFASMMGVPIIAKPSNTWKIDGLMELLRRSDAIADGAADLRALLGLGLPAPIERNVIADCRSRALLTVPALV